MYIDTHTIFSILQWHCRFGILRSGVGFQTSWMCPGSCLYKKHRFAQDTRHGGGQLTLAAAKALGMGCCVDGVKFSISASLFRRGIAVQSLMRTCCYILRGYWKRCSLRLRCILSLKDLFLYVYLHFSWLFFLLWEVVSVFVVARAKHSTSWGLQ